MNNKQKTLEIPFIDLRHRFMRAAAALSSEVEEIAKTGIWLDGQWTVKLESVISKAFQRRYGVAFGTGTDALTLAIRVLSRGGIGHVMMCGHGFVAQALACTRNRLPIILVDMDPRTGQMSVEAAREAFENHSIQGLYLSHLHGIPADAEVLSALARSAGAWIVEDFCQSAGAVVDGAKKVGTYGDISVTTVYPTKPIFGVTTGALALMDNDEYANVLRRGRLFGLKETGISDDPLMHSRISEISAAAAVAGFSEFQSMLQARAKICNAYDHLIDNAFKRLRAAKGDESAFHHYIIYVRDRASFTKSLHDTGIGSGCYYKATLDEHNWGEPLTIADAGIESASFHARCNVALPLWEGLDDAAIGIIAGAVNARVDDSANSV